MQPAAVSHIEVTPGVCGGKPRIAGARIRAEDIVVWHEIQGRSPNEIVADFPLFVAGRLGLYPWNS